MFKNHKLLINPLTWHFVHKVYLESLDRSEGNYDELFNQTL